MYVSKKACLLTAWKQIAVETAYMIVSACGM